MLIAPSLSAVPFPPLLMGKVSERLDPPPKDGPKQETSKEPAEDPRERERTPPKEPSREARRSSPNEPSHDRERTPDSSKLRSKESRKAEKHNRKESRRT